MEKCIFCKIIDQEIPSKKVYEDDDFLVIHDIAPQAQVHVLVIPKRHIASLNDTKDTDKELLGAMLLMSKKVAKDLGVDESGYRLVINTGEGGGQTVFHIHMHIIAGNKLSEKLV